MADKANNAIKAPITWEFELADYVPETASSLIEGVLIDKPFTTAMADKTSVDYRVAAAQIEQEVATYLGIPPKRVTVVAINESDDHKLRVDIRFSPSTLSLGRRDIDFDYASNNNNNGPDASALSHTLMQAIDMHTLGKADNLAGMPYLSLVQAEDAQTPVNVSHVF